jgi:hypothetical protein
VPQYLVNFHYGMGERVKPDEQYVIYSITQLDADRWFVESDKGMSGYSFHSLMEAERFAVTLAKRNTPSKVHTLDDAGKVIDELVFDDPDDSGR